jgi:hypothetical protein
MVGEMPVERSAQLILLLYLDKRGRPKVRIHGRPRSDRKKRFLLSAVAPGTSTRHPRKARPINWAQRGGLASGREMSPDAEATFHRASCTLGNQVVAASDGVPFRQERRPTRVCRTPGAGRGLLAEASTLRAGTANIPPCPPGARKPVGGAFHPWWRSALMASKAQCNSRRTLSRLASSAGRSTDTIKASDVSLIKGNDFQRFLKQIALAAAMVTALGLGGVPSLAHADVCNDGAVKPGPGSGDWYQCQGGTWRYYPPPTFDADAEPCYPSLVSPEITEPYEAAVERIQRPAHSRQQRP